jgi:glycosyltransferase involved in cell wall biosynthesis
VLQSLARQTGPFAREFIFVDDGSSDGSADLLEELTRGWQDKVLILRQPNAGASAATNRGARNASLPWLKLLDGDDLLVPGATSRLLDAASATGEDFAYGGLGTYRFADPDPLAGTFETPPFARERDGLQRFIRNCPCNSSSVLVSAARYWASGGCDERLVSPDQALFLRLFATGGAARVDGAVALVPDEAPRRLSEQRRRSRYESVLALYYLVTETKDLPRPYAAAAYRRALSRARRFHRAHGGAFVSRHLLRYLRSFVHVPAAPGESIYRALAAFTEDGSTERPPAWKPGAPRRSEGGA